MWDAVLWQAEHMHESPVIIVACCIMDDAEQDPGRYASSIWPGVQNLLLAARASGLGAVPTTYALAFRDELEAVLELPEACPRPGGDPGRVPAGALRAGAAAPGRRGPDVRRRLVRLDRETAVDGQHDTGDVTGLLRGEEADGGTRFGRRREAAHRDLRTQLLESVLRDRGHHVGLGVG